MKDWTTLQAGPLDLFFADGDLRRIRLGDVEVLRRVYVAVRDSEWGTIPARIENLEVVQSGRQFSVTYDAIHQHGLVDFRWRATIAGTEAGRITFAVDGKAHSTFLRNRIGICVHHPLRECAGQTCRVLHSDGTSETSLFPELVAPHQPFFDVAGIGHEIRPGVRAEVRFHGDVFETEDHRNWTDAGFKTYSTPLSLPFPVEIAAGTEVHQFVELVLEGDAAPPSAAAPGPVRVRVLRAPAIPLPRIGVTLPADARALTGVEIARIGGLRLSLPSEAAVPGGNANFAELNRNRPEVSQPSAACFAVNPQVHAIDDDSVMENCAAQEDAVRTARQFLNGGPVYVGPVRLRAGGPADPRQKQAFCAAWTVASLAALARGGAARVTYFESHGPGGLMDGDAVYPVFDVFRAVADFRDGSVLPTEVSDPLAVAALLLVLGDRRRLLLANLTDLAQAVVIEHEAEPLTLAPYEFRVLD